MSGSNRGIVLAFVGIALTGANEAPQKTAQPEHRQASTQRQNALPETFAPPTEPLKPVEPPEYYQPCRKAGSKGNSDLCAQWNAAEAARDAANWAWWQMWLSGLGVIGLGITLWFNFRALRLTEKEAAETKDALKIASQNASAVTRAAKAAQTANEIAREANYVQLRPYLYLTKVSVEYDHMHSIGHLGDTGKIVFFFENFGHSPARSVVLRSLAIIGGVWNDPSPIDLETAHPVNLEDYPSGYAGNRDGYFVHGIKAAHSELIRGKKSVFVVGQIQYRDGFGRTYFTNFRLASSEKEYDDCRFSVCPVWNDAS